MSKKLLEEKACVLFCTKKMQELKKKGQRKVATASWWCFNAAWLARKAAFVAQTKVSKRLGRLIIKSSLSFFEPKLFLAR